MKKLVLKPHLHSFSEDCCPHQSFLIWYLQTKSTTLKKEHLNVQAVTCIFSNSAGVKYYKTKVGNIGGKKNGKLGMGNIAIV